MNILIIFPVTSSLFSTSIVVEQIERLGLLVNVVFLGDRLTETVRLLESSSKGPYTYDIRSGMGKGVSKKQMK